MVLIKDERYGQLCIMLVQQIWYYCSEACGKRIDLDARQRFWSFSSNLKAKVLIAWRDRRNAVYLRLPERGEYAHHMNDSASVHPQNFVCRAHGGTKSFTPTFASLQFHHVRRTRAMLKVFTQRPQFGNLLGLSMVQMVTTYRHHL